MNRGVKGFTLVELIVVITVIAILATLTTLGFLQYQKDGRDAQRASNITTISEALEKYYDANGEYPGCSQLTGNPRTVSSSVLGGIDQSVFLAPQASSSAVSSMSCSDIAVSKNDLYEYKGDGSATCLTGTSCLRYTLRYREEASGNIVEVNSRRSAQLATSGIPTLTANGASMSSIAANWNAVISASGYELQASTTSDFSSGVTIRSVSGLSDTIPGLAYNTTYYVRVAGVSGTDKGTWSNVVTTSTQGLSAPTLAIDEDTATATQVSASWSTVAGSTSYNLQYSTNQSTWTSSASTATSQSVTGLTGATLYYYRVQARANSNDGPWSAVVSSYTAPAAPTALAISAAMSGTSAVGTASATCSEGTAQFQFRTRNTNTATAGTWSAWSAWGGSTNTISSTSQGFQYGFQQQARCVIGTTPSAMRNLATVATATRTFDAPGAPSVSQSTSGDITTFTRGTVTCAGNGTAEYRYRNYMESTYYSYVATTSTTATNNTSSQGYNYGQAWSARCVNTLTSGAYGSEGSASYTRPVSAPNGYGFNMWRESSATIRGTVTNSCGPGAILYGYYDLWAPSNWPWVNSSGVNEGNWGWRRESYGWVGGLNYWANSITTGATTSRSGGIPSSTWRIAGHYKCQNSVTGRNSGDFVYGESGAYNL